SFLDGRDAHPTITIKIVSYLIRDPKIWSGRSSFDRKVCRRKAGRSHRTALRKKRPKKDRSSAQVNPPGLAPATAAAFPPHLNRAAACRKP
ncbi:hypothetical protein, partial [Microcoleus sp. B4-C1]|uniref:hypothetical protein n=1 Tax=Microcoleus sp. B4-C1 TaxID=2818660 RepID=UPI002FD6618D